MRFSTSIILDELLEQLLRLKFLVVGDVFGDYKEQRDDDTKLKTLVDSDRGAETVRKLRRRSGR